MTQRRPPALTITLALAFIWGCLPVEEDEGTDDSVAAQLEAALAPRARDVDAALELARQAAREAEENLTNPIERARELDRIGVMLSDWCGSGPRVWDLAGELHERAHDLVEKGGAEARSVLSGVLLNLGYLALSQGLWDKAEQYYESALEKVMPGSFELGDVHAELAVVYFRQARYDEAEQALEDARALYAAGDAPAHDGIAEVFLTLSEIRRVLNDYDDAEKALDKAREHLRTYEKAEGLEDPLFLATIDNNLAGLHLDRGELYEAERKYLDSLAVRRSSPDICPSSLVTPISNLGEVYRRLGAYGQAERFHAEALDLASSHLAPGNSELALLFNRAAALYEEQGDHEEAEGLYRQALKVSISSLGEDHPQVAMQLHDLAGTLVASGRPEAAEELYRRALAIWGNASGHDPQYAFTLTELSRCLMELGRRAEARRHVDEALDFFSAAVATALPEVEAAAYEVRARLRKRSGDRPGALADLERSLRIIESLRLRAPEDERLRVGFLTRHADAYQRMVDWRLESPEDLHHAVAAMENARTRAFVSQLLRANVPLGDAAADGDEVQAEQLQRLERKTRSASRLWQTTAGAPRASLAQIQTALIPPGGTMLLYRIGQTASHVVVVPPAPRAAELVALRVRPADDDALGVEAGPLTRDKLHRILDGDAAGGLLARLVTHPSERAANDPALAAGLHALWRTLAPEEVWRQVHGENLVMVLPDGALHRLPFEALVVARGDTLAASRWWADEGPRVHYSPSATVLGTLAQRGRIAAGRDAAGPWALTVARPTVEPAFLARFGALAPLPGSRRESRAIGEAFGGSSTDVRTQNSETSERAVREAVAGKRYVHFATHAIVTEQLHSLSAALLLTPSGTGRHDDGILELAEIYGLDLDGCELAVLSACSSHVGPYVEGEGAFALSRGFLIAGAQRVVASLWPVEDASTAELMSELFAAVAAAERDGREPRYGAALARAKCEVRRREKWRDPYYWAPFILIGESPKETDSPEPCPTVIPELGED